MARGTLAFADSPFHAKIPPTIDCNFALFPASGRAGNLAGVKLLLRGILLAAIAAMLSGCVTTGADYASLSQKIGPPKAGQARIVVFREKAFRGALDGGYDIKLDGEPMKPLRTGTYFYADRPAGKHQMTCTATMFPGSSQFDVSVQPGRTYYYTVRPSERADQLLGAQMAGGLVGFAVGAALTSNSANQGPIDLFPVEEAAARAAMTELQLSE